MIRRNYLAVSGISVIASSISLYTTAQNNNQKPNIVIIVADDLGWGDVGYHGSSILTPNIDELSRKAIQLNRFYSAPISSPTRAGLLS